MPKTNLADRIMDARAKEAAAAAKETALRADIDRLKRDQEAAYQEADLYRRHPAHTDRDGNLTPDHAVAHANMIAAAEGLNEPIQAITAALAKAREAQTAAAVWLATVTATDAERTQAQGELDAVLTERDALAAQVEAVRREAAELERADDTGAAELQVAREDALAAGASPDVIDAQLEAAREAKRSRERTLRDLTDRERGLRRKLAAADAAVEAAQGRQKAVERAWQLGQLQGKARCFEGAVEGLRAAYRDLVRAAREFAAAGGRREVTANVFGPNGTIYPPAVPGIGVDQGPNRRPMFSPRDLEDA